MLVSEAYEAWLEDKRRTCQPSTIANYEHIGRAYVMPLWGHIDCSALSRDKFLERLPDITVGQQRRVKGCLAQCLDWAPGATGLDIRSVRIKNPKPDAKVRKVPTIAEAERIAFEAEKYTHYGDFIRLAVFSGLRWGELVALTPEDVDHELGLIDVNKAWCSRSNELKPPKSVSSIREVVVHPVTVCPP